ncbi:MarR family winged helix-turn-helix transcriptional regulator [Williamsia sterculiae]|nr:MarR family winged helix-turn-helix transcriptional regulator [Williamsia sterculiae]
MTAVEEEGDDVAWSDPDTLELWRAMVDGSQRVIGMLNQAMVDDAGMTLQDFRILLLLSESGDTRMSDVATGVAMARSTVSRQISRLTAAGLVWQLPDTHNGRQRLARITPAGRAQVSRAAEDHARRFREFVVDGLTLRQRQAVLGAYRKVDEGLRRSVT